MNSDEAYQEAERRIAEAQRTAAKQLSLAGLFLSELPEALWQLKQVETLYGQDNCLTVLPEALGRLPQLQELDVSRNYLPTLPQSLGQLTQLRELYVSENHLMGLPETLGQLTQLRTLDVSRNQLGCLPQALGQLTQLRELHVSYNQLVALPEFILRLAKLEYIYLQQNPDLGIPAEVVARDDDPASILDYYFRTRGPGGRQPLNEFKLILVGRGGVGKTTLVHRLVSGKYKKFKRTPGVKITQWPKKIDGEAVRAHVWDFGGQEIMHGTHRFFMTERAVYLVLISGREGTEDRDAEYWLSLIRSFAGNVPVIVLLHKWTDYTFELSRELLRQKYGKEIVFIETDSASEHGIDALRKEICRMAKKLAGLKSSWPAEWREIKEKLPAQRKNWLTFEDFQGFCAQHGVPKPEDQEALAQSLHDLGLMLSYRKEEALRGIGVLNPLWVTQGIYAMLNSPALRKAGGKFTVQSFGEVLPARTYPKQLHPYLLALMRKFGLCHPLDDKGVRHLIPELLSKAEPELDGDFPAKECLGFMYRYDAVLPEGLLPRFIVETYVHREPKHVWRTGVVLERANCRALVRGDVQGRKVVIRVAGPTTGGRRELLGIIREHFERIHATYEKLPVTEMVPIPGHPESQVEHEVLLMHERDQRDKITVVVGKELKDFSVKELLDGVDLPGVLRWPGRQADFFNALAADMAQHDLFISYSHKDAVFLDQLRGALVPYERNHELKVWADPLIEPGQKWEDEIFANLNRVDIVVLLLSNDFLRSYFCLEKELARAVERQSKGECEIIPIVVRACRFDKLPLGKIQAIIPGGKPVQQHRQKDPAWLEVTKQLDRVIERLKTPPIELQEPATEGPRASPV